MTKREFFVYAAAGEMTEEMMTFAAEQLVKMDVQREARQGKLSEKEQAKRDANVALATRVAKEILSAEAKTASDVAAELTIMLDEHDEEGNLIEVKVQKASALCRKAVELELAAQTEVKIPKKGTCKAYTAV